MKKVAYLGVILALLVFAVVPALAKGGNNGNGNSSSAGNSTTPVVVSKGDKDQGKGQDKDKNQDRDRDQNHAGGNGNQGQSSRMRTPFYLQGTLTAVDNTAKTITVEVVHANAQVKSSIGMTITLQYTDTTQIFKLTQGEDENETNVSQSSSPSITTTTDEDETENGNRVAISFDDLQQLIGDKVAIHGNLVNGVYQLTLVTVYVPMSVGEPTGNRP